MNDDQVAAELKQKLINHLSRENIRYKDALEQIKHTLGYCLGRSSIEQAEPMVLEQLRCCWSTANYALTKEGI